MAVSRKLGQLHKSRSSSSEGFGAESADQLHLLEAIRLREMEADSAELLRECTLTQEGLDSLIPAEGANEDDGDGSGVGTGPSLRFVNDQAWRQFNVALQNARNELEQALQEYGERHHRVKKCRVNVEHQERLLRNREVELSEERVAALRHVDPGLDGAEVPLDRVALERQTRRQKRRLELLDEDLEDQRAKVAQAAAIAEGAARLREGIDRVAKDFDVIRERERVLEMEDKAPARIGVADHAVVPTVPHRDRRFLLTVLALGGGLMTGLVIAHLRASLSPRICEPGDVQLTVRVPFLGQLPALPGGESPEADWNPAVVESVRMVRTALLQRLSGTDDRAVLITSASMQAGKTSVAIELAKSLAHLGKKTLLVEADLRRPSLSERLGLESTVGLAALLNGTATDHQAIVPGCVPQMDVLPAGERPEEFDSELLANGEFAAGLARWKTCYDFVLMDGPPVLPVADARILAGQADGTIMVLRSSHCRQTDVIQAYADLSAAGGTLLGTVLVGARLGGRYGYRGDYGAYQGGARAVRAGTGTE